MRTAWIIGGLLLGVGLVVVMLLEAGHRGPQPVETAPGPGPTQAPRPGLRGIGAANDVNPISPEGGTPTPSQLRRWIEAALREPLGSPRWESLLGRLNVPYADFAPYMTIILEACLRDTAEQCEAGARLLTIALDPGLLNYRMSRQRTPVIPLPSPLRPEHFDLAWRIATSECATEAAGALFADLRVLPALGPRAHELIPHAMAWFAREKQRVEEGRTRESSDDAEAWLPQGRRSSEYELAGVIGRLGIAALDHIDAWVTDEDGDGRTLAATVVRGVGVEAGPSLIAWLGAADARLRRGAVHVFRHQSFRWSDAVLQSVRARLGDPVASVREAAAAALTVWIGDEDVSADLTRALRGPDLELRVSVLESLSLHGTEFDEVPNSLLEAVLAIMTDPHEDEDEAVLAIAEVMASLPSASAMGPSTAGLLRALVRTGALTADEAGGWVADGFWRSTLGPQAWPHLWKGLHAGEEAMRGAAAWVMAWDGDPDAEHARLLGSWLEEHGASPLRTRVAAALSSARDAQVVPALLAGLKADTWSERGIAAMGLGRLGDEGLPHLGALGIAIGDANARRLVDLYESLPRRPDLPASENFSATLSMEEAFRSLARRDLEAAYGLIAHESWDVRFLVRGVLSRAKERGLAVVLKHWPRATHAERVASLHVMRRMSNQHPMWPEVLASFRSSDPAMRVAAAVLIFWEEEGLLAREASDVLADAAVRQTFDAPDMVGHRATKTLKAAPQGPLQLRALASLRRHAEHEDPAMRKRALELIKYVETSPAGLPLLR